MTGSEIRKAFLEFFRERGHEIVSSSSLVPVNDPTLLFSNAGMNQFKETFLGIEKRSYNRAVTSQKCVRAGGKHNDLENVGYTARHHTFFEMLGNFSFGDYFKRDAIIYAWDFLTGVMGLPKDKLYATVYLDDDEAADLWRDVIGLPGDRVLRLGDKDNFWSMGETGPCGPCSEILIDRGPEFSCGTPDCSIETCGCDRWLELWNLVFMQFNRDASGKMTPLPRPSIDTGMGLERITAVKQDAQTNFDTDLFMPVIHLVEELSGLKYGTPEVPVFPFRIIADHGRAATFLVADGVMPSNEGRGYVLRRILRRAVRYGKSLGIDEPFMHLIIPVVGKMMGDTYPEIIQKADLSMRVIRTEEERFRETLQEGTRRVSELVESARQSGLAKISGKDAFLLYDTFGFPIDLTEDMAHESGMSVDRLEFEAAMDEQRNRARAARRVEGPEAMAMLAREIRDLPTTQFVGYDSTEALSQVQAILVDSERTSSISNGQRASIIAGVTPFYAESGGQSGDTGLITSTGGKFRVENTIHMPDGRTAHVGQVESGSLTEGDAIMLSLDVSLRRDAMRNHSATHLLQRALRVVLGEHVNQAGSLVTSERLRFDFTHFSAVTAEELKRVEDLVNQKVLEDLPVTCEEMGIDDAKARGATALFGEKYGTRVRVVAMGDYSMELCGGTHVRTTGQIGLVRLLSEASVGAGLRRIEAVTGMRSLAYVRAADEVIQEIAREVKASSGADVGNRVRDLAQHSRDLQKELEGMAQKAAKNVADTLLNSAVERNGVKVVAAKVDATDIEAMRSLGDLLRDRLGDAVVVLMAGVEDKVSIVVMASKGAVGKGIHAGKIAKEAAAIVGGSGGGRPDMAQAGGRNPAAIDEALKVAVGVIENLVSR